MYQKCRHILADGSSGRVEQSVSVLQMVVYGAVTELMAKRNHQNIKPTLDCVCTDLLGDAAASATRLGGVGLHRGPDATTCE